MNLRLGHTRVPLLLVAALLAGLITLLVPAGADAQSICQAYPDLPQCQQDEGGGGGDDDGTAAGDGAGFGPGVGVGGSGSLGDGGNLPFTGYPLTPLVWVVLALIAAGLATRVYLAVRNRAATSSPAAN